MNNLPTNTSNGVNKLLQRSFLNALGTGVYVTAIAALIYNGNKIFGQKDTAITPIIVLMLFVVSAAITGSLVLGKPVLMFLEGQKNQAIKLFIYTVGWLFLILVILVLANLRHN
jgi:heme O synthase-like polyprenyltransferase